MLRSYHRLLEGSQPKHLWLNLFRLCIDVIDIGPLLKSWISSDNYIFFDITKLYLDGTSLYLFLAVMVLEDLSK